VPKLAGGRYKGTVNPGRRILEATISGSKYDVSSPSLCPCKFSTRYGCNFSFIQAICTSLDESPSLRTSAHKFAIAVAGISQLFSQAFHAPETPYLLFSDQPGNSCHCIGTHLLLTCTIACGNRILSSTFFSASKSDNGAAQATKNNAITR